MGAINTDNYTIGMAELWFNSTIAEDTLANGTVFQTSANNLGNIVTTGITPEVTYIDHWKSKKGRRVKDKTVVNTKSVMVNFTFDEMNESNLGKFFLADSVGSALRVLENALDEGSAQLMIHTDVGQDMIYRIPKCVLKPDGAYELNAEDWHSVPMVLEILEYQNGDNASDTLNATWLNSPYGRVDTSGIA